MSYRTSTALKALRGDNNALGLSFLLIMPEHEFLLLRADLYANNSHMHLYYTWENIPCQWFCKNSLVNLPK